MKNQLASEANNDNKNNSNKNKQTLKSKETK